MRRGPLVALSVLAAATGLGLWLLRPAGTAPPELAAPPDEESSATAPHLAAVGDAPAPPSPPSPDLSSVPATGAALPTDPREARLTVRVAGPDGAPLRDGTVLAVRRSEVVARAALTEAGAYVTAAARGDAAEPPIRLIVMPSGYAVMRVWAPVRVGTHRALDLKIPDGPVTSGLVVDGEGRPVANLRVLVVDARTPMTHLDSRSIDPALRAAQGGEGPVWATARTDESGGFAIRAAWSGERRLVSADPAWFVRQGDTFTAGTTSLHAVAVPGRSLSLRVRTASGLPWTPWCVWRLTVRDRGKPPTSLYASGGDGATDVVWPLGDPASLCDVDVELESENQRGKTSVAYEAGQARASAEIPLVAEDPALTGRLVAVVTDARGEPVDHPLNVALSDPRARDEAPRWRRLSRESANRHVLEGIPAGRHAIRIEAAALFSPLVSWRGEVDVPARGEAVARVGLPTSGWLRVRGTFPAGRPYLSLTVERTDGASEPVNQTSPLADFRMLLPEGAWRISSCDPPGHPKVARDVRITPAAEAFADFLE